MEKITILQQEVPFLHIQKSNLKNIYIKIDQEGTVVLKSPKISRKRAVELLTKKANWIIKKRSEILSSKPKEIQTGTIISCYDKSYIAEVSVENSKVVKLIKDSSQLKFKLGHSINQQLSIQLLLDKFYQSESKRIIPERLVFLSHKTGLNYQELKFRKMKRQWGNCSFKNTITINSKASILAPDELDYLLIHELCHTKVKNHSKAFWLEVEKHLPNYKSLDKSLKKYRLD